MEKKMSETQIGNTYENYLLNVLNEVLHGFPVDFEAQLRAPRATFAKIYQNLNCEPHHYALSSNEAALLLDASLLCGQEFEGEEFETRLGISRPVAHGLNEMLRSQALAVAARQA